jgi:hypothetical protein
MSTRATSLVLCLCLVLTAAATASALAAAADDPADGLAVAQMVRDLKSSDEATFQGAVKRLPTRSWGHAVDRAIVEMLLTARVGDAPLAPSRQVALIRALGRCPQGCASVVLRRKAASADPTIREAARAALEAQASLPAHHRD